MLGFLKNRRPKEGDKAGEEVKFTGANEMTDMLAELGGSKKKHSSKGGFFGSKKDSVEFMAVTDAIWDVLAKTSVKFSSDAATNDAILVSALDSYGRLVLRCTKYLGKAGGKTQSGKMRKQKVQMILDMAVQDCERIEYYRRENQLMNAQERSNLTWDEIIYTAREALIEVEDITKYTALGAGVKKGDAAGRLLNGGVFSPEAKISRAHTNDFGTASFNVGFGIKEHDIYLSDTEKLNHSGRNVAMSRVAKLIGVEGIIEESATVKVKDKKTGNMIKGNLMSIAKGSQALELSDGLKKEVIKENNTLESRESAVKNKMTGSFRKELSSLQVLDYLCGQGDRNTKNYFIEQDKEGRFAHVHAIDNDMAFGTGVDLEDYQRYGGADTDIKMRMVVDSHDNLRIPRMDKTLAKNILGLKDEELRFAIGDIVEDRFIDYTIQRLHKLQNAIRKEESAETGKFIENDADWENTHDAFAKKGYYHKMLEQSKRKGFINDDFEKMNNSKFSLEENMEFLMEESYYSVLVENMMGAGGKFVGGRNFRKG